MEETRVNEVTYVSRMEDAADSDAPLDASAFSVRRDRRARRR